MPFNIDKCKVMHLGHKNTQAIHKLGSDQIKTAQEEQDLGIIMSADLKVAQQCKKAANTANKVLGMIKRTTCYKQCNIVLPLYKALVRSPHLQKEINILQTLQKRATKMITDYEGLEYSIRLQRANLTTLETRRISADLLEVFKIFKQLEGLDRNMFFNINPRQSRDINGNYYTKEQDLAPENSALATDVLNF